MADYTSTYTKTTGNTVEASDFSTEFDAIETMSQTKVDETSGTLTGGTLTNCTGSLTNIEIDTIEDSNNNELLDFVATGSAVNNVQIRNNSTGNQPVIESVGESDIGLLLRDSNNNELLDLAPTASATAQVQISNGVAVASVAASGLTNATLNIDSAGTGNLVLNNTATGDVVWGSSRVARYGESSVTATTSGTSVIVGSIPDWAKKVRIVLNGVSHNASLSSSFDLRLGDSGGIEATTYDYTEFAASSYSNGTATEWTIYPATNESAVVLSGEINLCLSNSSINKWTISSQIGTAAGTAGMSMVTGGKALSGTLTQIQLFVTGGADFDAGNFIVYWER